MVRTSAGADLIVGSANLTRSAYRENHELGVFIRGASPVMQRSFERFVTSLAPRVLEGDNFINVLKKHGLGPPEQVARPSGDHRRGWQELVDVFFKGQPLPEATGEISEPILRFIEAGFFVGRGRRESDAFVVRLPIDAVEASGLVQPVKRKVLGEAARESRSLGFSIELLPAVEAADIRRGTRRVGSLLSRLSLNLPCYGNWMPASFWDRFIEARDHLVGLAALSPDRIEHLASRQREYLLKGGIDESLNQIFLRLEKNDALKPEKRELLRRFLRPFIDEALAIRTPDLLAASLEFRTARQQWSPFDKSDAPYRSLMVDILKSVLGSTMRTGKWPARHRSYPAHQLAQSIAAQLLKLNLPCDGNAAFKFLQCATTWEHGRPMNVVVEEFRRLVPDDISFEPPSLEELLKEDPSEPGDRADG